LNGIQYQQERTVYCSRRQYIRVGRNGIAVGKEHYSSLKVYQQERSRVHQLEETEYQQERSSIAA
jgi:hypothetical protein